MSPEDLESVMKGVAAIVRREVDATEDKLMGHVHRLEQVRTQDGRDGKDVDPVLVKALIDAAVAELPKPKDGIDGRDGRDAREGSEIVIRQSIDPIDSYARGTYAAHAGGLVVAYRQTDPLHDQPSLEFAGWQVILNGIKHESEKIVDEGRFIERTTAYTNGTTSVRRLKTVGLVHREWKYGTTYQQGDVVSYAGSAYSCTRSTKSSPQRSGGGWRLLVKAAKSATSTAEG